MKGSGRRGKCGERGRRKNAFFCVRQYMQRREHRKRKRQKTKRKKRKEGEGGGRIEGWNRESGEIRRSRESLLLYSDWKGKWSGQVRVRVRVKKRGKPIGR